MDCYYPSLNPTNLNIRHDSMIKGKKLMLRGGGGKEDVNEGITKQDLYNINVNRI